MVKQKKHSKKRDAIYEAIRSTKSHPNAEWVYNELKPRFPDISLGTVYRNIAMFKEEGGIVCVGAVNGQERYDGNIDPHAHFICKGCGRVDDVMELEEPDYPQVDGRIDSSQTTFYGLCGSCYKKEAH